MKTTRCGHKRQSRSQNKDIPYGWISTYQLFLEVNKGAKYFWGKRPNAKRPA